MEIKEAQNKVKEFDTARGWENDWNIKDLLLNITEEGGELWDLIKWVDNDKQKQLKLVVSKYKNNFIDEAWKEMGCYECHDGTQP